MFQKSVPRMITSISLKFILIFMFIGSLCASVAKNSKDCMHPLARKQYPKSDYGYKPTLFQCLNTKSHHSQPICKRKKNYTSSKPAYLDKVRHCKDLRNCGYGYPESFDNRVLSPYTNTITGFIPKACLPRGYIGTRGRHMCDRKCGGPPKICYYRLSIEAAETHHPYYCSEECKKDKNCPNGKCILTDGVRSRVSVYNYMLPGPTIAVCTGDTVVIDVVNHLSNFTHTYLGDKALERNIRTDMKIFKAADAESEAPRIAQEIFLHYVQHKSYLEQSPSSTVDTQPMSMVAAKTGETKVAPLYASAGEDTTVHFHGITQIETPQSDGPPGVTQPDSPYGTVFRYRWESQVPGPLFYHSHTAGQRGEGAFGALIVRDSYDPNCKHWDYDYTEHMLIITDFGYNRSHNLDTILINSHGCNLQPNATHPGYLTTLKFKPNKRYLVRFCFNGITATKIKCYVDGLRFLMTVADTHPVNPIWIDSFVLANGERIQGVFTFDKVPTNHILHCFPLRNPALHQFAVFHVKGAPQPPTCKQLTPVPAPVGIEYNTENAVPGTNGTVTTSELIGLWSPHPIAMQKLCKQIFIIMTISGRGIQINSITDMLPKEPYLCEYYRKGYINETNVCNAESLAAKGIDCSNTTCSCQHINKVQEGDCVEFICIGPHPLHLHGYSYYVVYQGKSLDNGTMTKEKFLQYDRDGLIKRNLINPPQKDTITVPANGYAVLRIAATNPGFWKTHCHIELHGMSGMSFVLWVQSKNENIKKRIKNYVCEPFLNNVCRGDYCRPKKTYY